MHTYTDPAKLAPADRYTGVVRRLRALAWMGHDPAVVAHKYDADVLLVRFLCNAHSKDNAKRKLERDGVPVDLWYAVATAYDDLSMSFGPSEHYRAKARALGWMPPLAWDDEALDDRERGSNKLGKVDGRRISDKALGVHDHAVVIRRINGDHTVHMRKADRLEAVRILHTQGMTDWAIADALGMWTKQIERDRHELGLASNYDAGFGRMTANYTPGLFSRAKVPESNLPAARAARKRAARARELEVA